MGTSHSTLIDLRDLPHEHSIRNTPLSVVRPGYRLRGESLAPKPCAHWKIGRFCYNDLEPFWGELGEFLVDLGKEEHAQGA